MIVLYDLVFQDDRRPSPFCWRVKYALRHKGLDWREEPVGFTDKDRIAFAGSQTVPVIEDGATAVKDSWAIARHLDATRPGKPLFPGEAGPSYARFVSNWGDTSVHGALFPLVVGDLYDRVRPVDQPYFREQPFLSGAAPAYPDYALVGAFLWARIASPLELLADDDPVRAWRETMLDLYGGLGRNARAA